MEEFGGHVIGIGDGELPFFAFLCGHEHNTVGAASTVNCRGGGIFQNLDGFDVVGVDVETAGCLKSVYDV